MRRLLSIIVALVIVAGLGFIAVRTAPSVLVVEAAGLSAPPVLSGQKVNPVVQSGGGQDAPNEAPPETTPVHAAPAAIVNTPGLHYLIVKGYDFHPDASDTSYANINGGVYIRSDSAGTLLFARLQLPQGAQVVEVGYFYFDNDAEHAINLALWRSTPSGNIEEPKASFLTPAALNANRSNTYTADPFFTVDNSQYAYYIFAGFNDKNINLRLNAVRIGYKIPAVFVPSVHRNSGTSW